MNKLRNELMLMKIQINSTYGITGINTDDYHGRRLYDEMLKKKSKFFKIQKRVSKIKRIFNV
jgi:CDP-diacylglycerol pyrophosphatase